MPTLGDIARQANAPPDRPETSPQKRTAPTLGDIARQATAPPPDKQPAPPPDEQPPELLRRPEEEPPPPPPRRTGEVAGAVVGQRGFIGPYRTGYRFGEEGEPQPGPYAEGYEFPDPNAVREPTWGESAALTAARVVPPIAAAAVTTPFLSPVGGTLAAGLAGTAGDIAAQRYERAHGLRKEVRPYESIVTGGTAMFPGAELAPGTSLATRAATRAAEGATINLASDVARSELEGRPMTVGDVARSVTMGGGFGGITGAGEHGLHYVLRRPETPAFDIRPVEEQFPVGSDIHYDNAITGQRERGTVSEHWTNPETGETHAVTRDLDGTPVIAHEPEHAPQMVTKPGETIEGGAPPVPPGHARFYHAGADPAVGGRRWVHPDEQYVRNFRPGADVYYTDIPESSPLLRKTFDDSGTGMTAPYVPFEMPEELTPTLRPVRPPAPEPIRGVPAETSVEGRPAPKEVAEAPKPPAEGEQLSFETPSYQAVPKVEAPKPPLERAEPTPEPGRFEQPSFQRVPGLHEAAYGEKVTPARPRDPERLAGEIDAVDREYAHLPEESRNVLKQVKLDQAEDTAWRARETQPVQRTMDLADELVFDPEVAAKKARGETWKAEEMHAAGSHIADILDDMQALAEHVRANPDDLAAQLRLKKKQTELILSVGSFEGAKAETGRALNILKYQMTALRKGDPGLIKAALKLGAKADDILNIMRLPTDAEKMKALMALRKPSRWEIARSYWMSNLLSGPKTLIRNTIGNTVPPVLDILTTPIAAGIEHVRGVPLAERTVFAGEVRQKLRATGLFGTEKIGGMQFGLREAIRQASEVFQQGFGRSASWETLPPVSWADAMFPNAPHAVRRVLDYPARALAATDTAFRTLNYHMDIYGGAYAQAKRELGLQATRAALEQRMTDIISRPADHPEIFANAEKNAERRVYQEKGKFGQWLAQGKDIGGMGYVVPFVKTPAAIVRQGMQLTPLGFAKWTHGLEPTARMSAQIRGEAAFGSLLMSGLALGVATGQIKLHGAGPQDPVERDKFYNEGHRPNSVEILGHDFGYSVLGPLAQPISLVANYFDAYQDAVAKGDSKTAFQIAEEAAGHGTALAVKSIRDQSFVRGLSELNNVLSDPEHFWARFTGQLAAGFIPYSGAVRSVTQATDPVLRKPETPQEYVQTGLPPFVQRGLGLEPVPPRLRATGEPIEMEQAGGAWGRALLPTDVSTVQSSPVQQELDKHGVRLTFPEGQVKVKVGGGKKSEPLSREDETTVAMAKGQATMAALDALITQPSYQKADERVQGKQLQHTIDTMRAIVQRRAAAALMAKRPLSVDDLMPPVVRKGAPAAAAH